MVIVVAGGFEEVEFLPNLNRYFSESENLSMTNEYSKAQSTKLNNSYFELNKNIDTITLRNLEQ